MIASPDISRELETSSTVPILDVPLNFYDLIIKQRHLQLLGRTIDLSALIANLINQYLRKSIDVAISRFEGSDLTYLVVCLYRHEG
jgi:hypothetical protein